MEASSAERRSEIYTYEAPHPVFAMNWSVRAQYPTRPDNRMCQERVGGRQRQGTANMRRCGFLSTPAVLANVQQKESGVSISCGKPYLLGCWLGLRWSDLRPGREHVVWSAIPGLYRG